MQTLLEIGLANVLMASALALLAALAGLFCRRPAVRHTFWLLVLLKLITPPLWSIPIRCPAALAAVVPDGKWLRCAARPSGGGQADACKDSAWELAGQLKEEGIKHPADPAPAAAPVMPARSAEEPQPPPASTASGRLISWSHLVCAGWLTGSLWWLAVAGARIGRFQRLLRYGSEAPRPLQEQARMLAERLGLRRCPAVWLIPGRVSPLLWGLGSRVRLVLPTELLPQLQAEQCASLLAHELAHARRRDHWVRWLELLVGGLYWWLPVAWWARRQLQLAEEECCDAWVVWTLPTAAKAYAKALLQTVAFLDARPALPPVASGVGHLRFLRRRLAMIGRRPLYPPLPWPVHLGVVLLGLCLLPFAPPRLAAQDSQNTALAESAADTALVQAQADPANRDLERRLRALEDKMERLLRKLEAQRGDQRLDQRSGRDERSALAEDKARAKEKERADKAREKTKADLESKLKRWGQRNEAVGSEELDRLKKNLKELVNKEKELSPQRMEELRKRILQEAVKNKSLNPAQLEVIQQKVEDAFKKSATLKKHLAEREWAEVVKQPPPGALIPERSRDEERSLERRLDRLEQKMDRVLQALEKTRKPGT